MSTRQLAAAAGVSLATVVRLPRLLGYPSFEALRAAIQDRVNFDLTGVERLRALPSGTRSPAALLRRIIDRDLESLRGLVPVFSEADFDRFVGTVLLAPRVTILGVRWVRPLAQYFGYSLGKVRPAVHVMTHADSTGYDHLRLMHTDVDLIVALAFARYPSDLVALIRHAHKLGLRVLAITDSPLSPLYPLADVTLIAKTSTLDFDFVGSLAAPAALINCAVSEIGVRLGEQAVTRLQALEDAASEAGTYVRGGGGISASPEPPGSSPGTTLTRGRLGGDPGVLEGRTVTADRSQKGIARHERLAIVNATRSSYIGDLSEATAESAGDERLGEHEATIPRSDSWPRSASTR